MDTTQPSETPTPILEIFSEKILEEIILQYFGVIDEVERIINEFVDNKPIPDLLIADHLKEYEKNELGNIQQNIQSLNNFDIYDSLSLACLSGVYYNLSKVDFFAKIETRITNYPSLVLNLKDKIRDKFLGYSDSYIQTNKLNIESLSKREKYYIDQIHYLFLEKVNKLEDKIITSFFDNILLFINLSKRLIIESDTHVIDIQSKQFDYGLNEKCNNLKDLIQDNQFKEALFIINLKLAELDEFLSCKDHFLNELIDYHTILELISDRFLNDPITQHTCEKSSFLIYKILRRINKSSKLTNDGIVINNYYKSQQLNFSSAEIEMNLIREISPYLEFYDKLLEVYNLEIKRKLNLSKISNFQTLHLFFKILKNKIVFDKKVHSQFENDLLTAKELNSNYQKLVKKVVEKNSNNQFTTISFEYLIDNITILSDLAKLIDDLTEIDKINKVYNDILDKLTKYIYDSEKQQNPKYIFPNLQKDRYFILYIEKLLDKTKDILKNTKKIGEVSVNDIENFENLISEVIECAHKITKIFFKNLHVLKNKNYYPIYNDLASCYTIKEYNYSLYTPKVKVFNSNFYTDVKSRLFLDSSYVLPANYTFLKFDMDEKIRNINNINSQLLSFLEVFLTRNVERTLDSKLKENQFNAIQTLSVYAIVITYILGSITVLPKFDAGFKIAPYFLLLLALMLGFFGICIRFLFINERFIFKIGRKKYEFQRWILYLVALFIISLVVYYKVLPKFEGTSIQNSRIEYKKTYHTNNKDTLSSDSLNFQYYNSQ